MDTDRKRTNNPLPCFRELPTIELEGKSYYFDKRLRQLRPTASPGDPIDFINLFSGEASAIEYILETGYKELIQGLLDDLKSDGRL